MEIIWAPWRMKYINGDKKPGCIFCKKPKESADSDNFILERTKSCFVMLNAFPYNNAHIMIAPFRHIKGIEQLSKFEREDIFNLLSKYKVLIEHKFKAQGFNVGINMGSVAGAGFAGHIHVHLVPRWSGDTNFISATGQVRVIPESLKSVYRKLKK